MRTLSGSKRERTLPSHERAHPLQQQMEFVAHAVAYLLEIAETRTHTNDRIIKCKTISFCHNEWIVQRDERVEATIEFAGLVHVKPADVLLEYGGEEALPDAHHLFGIDRVEETQLKVARHQLDSGNYYFCFR